MALGEYLIGFAFFAGTFGGVGFATWRLTRAHLRHLRGSALATGAGVVATAILVGVHLAPGLFGLLSREVVLVLSLAVATASLRARPAALEPREQAQAEAQAEPDRFWSWPVALAGAGALAIYVLAAVASHASLPPTGIDALTFHIPGLGRWMQSGSYWQVDNFVPQIATGNYPQNGNLVELSVVLPWSSDFLYRLSHVPFLGLFALSIHAISRELGAARPTSLLLASMLTAMPIVFYPAVYSSIPDVVLLATMSAGLLFLLREWRGGRRSELILAGLGLGLAFGTKWYGVTSVGFIAAVWLAAMLIARRPGLGRRTAVLTGLIALAGGFWLLRNLVESGNPIFPVRLSLGPVVFDAPPDPRGDAISSIADYAGDVGIWREYILPAFARSFGAAAVLLGLSSVVAVGLGLRRTPGIRGERQWGAWLGLAAIGLAIVYAATPATAPGPPGEPVDVAANTRYLVPALVVAGAALAWSIPRLHGARPWVEVALLVCLADALRRGTWPAATTVAAAAATVVVVAAAVRFGLPTWEALRRAPRLAGGALAVGVLGVAAVGYTIEHRFRNEGYGGLPTVDRLLAEAPEGHQIGLAGVYGIEILSPVRAAFGPEFGNEVSYVGSQVEGEIRQFESRDPFVEAVDERAYDFLLIGRGDETVAPTVPEERWARAAGFDEIDRDERLTLFSRSGG